MSQKKKIIIVAFEQFPSKDYETVKKALEAVYKSIEVQLLYDFREATVELKEDPHVVALIERDVRVDAFKIYFIHENTLILAEGNITLLTCRKIIQPMEDVVEYARLTDQIVEALSIAFD